MGTSFFAALYLSLTFLPPPFRIAFGDHYMEEKELKMETGEIVDEEPLAGQINLDELLAELRL